MPDEFNTGSSAVIGAANNLKAPLHKRQNIAMDKSAADSFVYAKASGMLASSFVGARARQLFVPRTLSDLWALLFKTISPALPGTLLARALENEAAKSFIESYKRLIMNYSHPHAVLLALLRNFDYENLKDIGASLAIGEMNMPEINNIEPFNIIDYNAWPDIKAITAGGPLSWYNEIPEHTEEYSINSKLDNQYIDTLWEAAESIRPAECGRALLKLFEEKFSVENTIWALRLRIYYEKSKEEILSLLNYSTPKRSATDPLVVDTVETLDWDLDNYEKWKTWRYTRLLNPHEEGIVWNINPRWLTNAYKGVYIHKVYNLFHRFPLTSVPLVCWYILKRNELDDIRTAAESLRLNIEPTQAMQIAGITKLPDNV